MQKRIAMDTLKIPYFKALNFDTPTILSERLIASGSRIKIDQVNWDEFRHRPDVWVYTGHCDQKLWLHYIVLNDFVRAVCTTDQEPVWQDSCVEFFLKQGDIYRNFEFNCLGVCLSAFGADRQSRQSLDAHSMEQIVRFSSLKPDHLPSGDNASDWTLTVGIPLDLIGLSSGSLFMANFYKCGDNTKLPHYLSWNAISTSSPDFHRPEFFSPVELMK